MSALPASMTRSPPAGGPPRGPGCGCVRGDHRPSACLPGTRHCPRRDRWRTSRRDRGRGRRGSGASRCRRPGAGPAVAQADGEQAVAPMMVEAGARRRGHRWVLPSARIAAAASSALISWRARAWRISSRLRPRSGFGRRLVGLVGLGPGPEAERPDERLDPRADGRIADPELSLHLAQVAAGPEEALEQCELLAVETTEAPDAEVALERRAAAGAMETGDGQLAGADRTG